MRRVSLLLDEATVERLQFRARCHGTSLSEEVRAALDRDLGDENPNQGLLDLAEAFRGVEFKPGPPIDSDEFKDEFARFIYRDSFNREPDW